MPEMVKSRSAAENPYPASTYCRPTSLAPSLSASPKSGAPQALVLARRTSGVGRRSYTDRGVLDRDRPQPHPTSQVRVVELPGIEIPSPAHRDVVTVTRIRPPFRLPRPRPTFPRRSRSPPRPTRRSRKMSSEPPVVILADPTRVGRHFGCWAAPTRGVTTTATNATAPMLIFIR